VQECDHSILCRLAVPLARKIVSFGIQDTSIKIDVPAFHINSSATREFREGTTCSVTKEL
jgi:hypothetical protein